MSQLGLYDVPKHGLTPYPDQKMVGGIKKFQAAQNLKVTGVIRPGDATAKRLEQLSCDEGSDDDSGDSDYRCPECGAPHGGSGEPGDDRCPDCRIKG